MLKRIILAVALTLLPAAAAQAENGCDGYCRDGGRNRGHDRNDYRGRDRHHGRHYVRPPVVYYHRTYYRSPRVVYAPAPVIVQQPQVIYINDSNSRQISSNDGRYCREYTASSSIAGARQQTYGRACMQPDGSWEIIS